MISGLRKIREISQKTDAAAGTLYGYTSQFLPGAHHHIHIEECHYTGTNRATALAQVPFHHRPGEATLTYLLCGSLKFTTATGDSGQILPGGCLWINNATGSNVEFESATPPMQEFWSVYVCARIPGGIDPVPPLSCEIQSADIPVHRGEDGTIVKVVAGKYEGLLGPLYMESGTVLFLDISIPPLTPFTVAIPREYRVLLYCLEGSGLYDYSSSQLIQSSELIRYGRGEGISLSTETEEVRLLLIGGTHTALTEL
jgi:quercetin 2,3-dioxygenase